MTTTIRTRRHGMTAELAEAAKAARDEGLRVADHFERPLGPPVACAIDIQPSPLHTPPEGYEWSAAYLGGAVARSM